MTAMGGYAPTIGIVGTRINYDVPGTRSLFTSTGRQVRRGLEPPYQAALLDINEDWGSPALWSAMREASSPVTSNFYLAAVDRTRADDGSIAPVEERQQVYVMLFMRTFWLSLVITATTFVLGFPIAHLLATLPMRKSNLLMILVLVFFVGTFGIFLSLFLLFMRFLPMIAMSEVKIVTPEADPHAHIPGSGVGIEAHH